ncbi:lipopolysaccharide biosynthesis protein [Nocardioides sp. Kera G14]|uniref:lipopolysaccharide biosynthesis protein n=1 Tax=Nocardioides sp. Kera G14 TaxID=2884264 RepID=UPI00223921B4|nr:lipopolysaccharide biosynthesis protein [Nocardioides sp. Kera G14]
MQIVALVLFSRLLDPHDFGIVAMVTAVVGVAYVLGDFGLSLAALQARDLTQGQRSNLFWISTGIGVAIGIAILGAAPLLAEAYGQPAVRDVAVALSLVFVANGITGQFRTELNRDRSFGVLASVDVLAQVLGLGLGLGIILLGGRYWGLVGQQVGAAWFTAFALAVRSGWRPDLPRRGESMRGLLRFGLFTLLAQVVNYISSNADSVIIGQRWGAATLGVYNRAWQVARLPVQQIASPLTRVVLPHLSSRLEDPEGFALAVRRGQLVLTTLLLGTLSLITAATGPLVDVVLGHGWESATPFIRAMCLGSAFHAVGYIYYWILLAHGRTGILFGAELGARIGMVVLMILAASHGAVWVALASAAGEFAILIIGAAVSLPRVGVSATPLLRSAIRSVVLFAFAAAVTWATSTTIDDWAALAQLAVLIPAWLATCVASLGLPAYRRDLDELVRYGRSVLRRGQVA